MSDAEEIKRLADLRDQGLITTAEFSKKKQQILKGRKGTSKVLIVAAWLIIILMVAGLLVRVLEKLGGEELACDTPEIKEKALVLSNEYVAQMTRKLGIFAAKMPPGQQIHSLGGTTQLYRDPESGFLACTAKTQNDRSGEGEIGYTVSWSNRSSGQFWVEVVNAEALTARYGNAAN